MIKIAAFTSSADDPASRFRIRQYARPLAAHDISLREHYPPIHKGKFKRLPWFGALLRLPEILAARSCDLTWFGREMVGLHRTLERFAPGAKLFDVDDAIWLQSRNSFSESIAALCDGVIAGNQFLAAHYEKHGARRVWVVPTSLDTDRWRPPRNERQTQQPWTIGWSGIWSNLHYLYAIEEPLAEFLTAHKETRLDVICDRRPSFRCIPADAWRYVPWSQANEVRAIQDVDVGLMPLDDTPWARGKCAFKMLLSLAVERTVVVSPVGVNREVLERGCIGLSATTMNEWYEALRILYHDRELARRMGVAGRRIVTEHYSVAANTPVLVNIFREVLGL